MLTSLNIRSFASMVCLALLSGCIGFSQARFEGTRTLTIPHEPGSGVNVATANGNVVLHAGTGAAVQIEATLRCTTAERLAETQIVANRQGQTLKIEVSWPGGKRENNEMCSFDITLPAANGVEVRTSNGTVKSTGLAGGASLHTSNGMIEVINHDGAVEARSSNGRIVVHAATGDVTAHTSNGSIDVQDARHSVEAVTSNGKAVVELAENSPGPVRIESSNGAIDLKIGSAFSGQLKMSTSNGGIDIAQFPTAKSMSIRKNSGDVIFGEGGASELRTSNGSISVRPAM